MSRACATGDLNGDGFFDLVALDLGGPVRVLLNRGGGDGHFLRVRLRGAGPNRFGLGARLTARWGDRSRTVEITSAGGYQAAVLPEAHFGLGAAEKVDELVVRWPSGVEQVLTDVAVDRVLVVEEQEQDG